MLNRNKFSKLKKNYTKIPNKIFEIGLSSTGISLFCYLAKVPDNFNPSVGVIARSLKISKTTAIKYIQELKDRNIIKLVKQGGQNTLSEYEFVDIQGWK